MKAFSKTVITLILSLLLVVQTISIFLQRVEGIESLVITPPYSPYCGAYSYGETETVFGLPLGAWVQNSSWIDSSSGRGNVRVLTADGAAGMSYGYANFYMSDRWDCTAGSGKYRVKFFYTLEGLIRMISGEPGAIHIPGLELLKIVSPAGNYAGLKVSITLWDRTEGYSTLFWHDEIIWEKNWWWATAEVFGIPTAERKDFYGEGYSIVTDLLDLVQGHSYQWSFRAQLECYSFAFGYSLSIAEGDVDTELYMVVVEPESVIPSYDIEVTTSANPKTVTEGEVFTVNGDIKNLGKGGITNVLATLNLPAGLSLSSGSNPQSWTTIPPGEQETAQWIVRADSSGQHELSIDALCDQGVSDISYETVSVEEPTYELDVTARAPESAIKDNEFTVIGQVKNKRGGDMHNVVTTLNIPSSLVLVSGTNSQSLGTIAVDDHKNASWTVRGESGGTHSLAVDAACDEGATDVDGEMITIYDLPAISIEILTSEKALAETPFRVEARIRNTGDIIIHNIASTLSWLPAGLTLYPEDRDNPVIKDDLPPGDDTTAVWYLQGEAASYTLHVDVTCDEGSSGHNQRGIEVVGSLMEASLLWNYLTGGWVRGVASGDIDGDGINDVAAASLDNKIYAIGSNGTQLWNFPTSGGVICVAVGDLNGDGFGDVVGGGYDSYLYALNGSDGTLLPGWPKWAGGDTNAAIYDVQVGDFDGDGKGDVASSTVDFGDVYAFRGYDGHQFWRHTHTDYVRDIGVGDINGDNKDDVAVGVWSYPGEVYAYRGYDGATIWGPKTIQDEARTVDVGDLNGDGKGDVVVGMDFSTTADEVYAYSSSGSLLWSTNFGWRVNDVKIGDIDGDGDNDVAVGADSPQDTVAMLDGANGQTLRSIPLGVGECIYSVAIGDLDDDGINDVAAGGTIGKVWAIKSDGSVLWNFTCGGEIYLHGICVNDINGDGTKDVIAGSYDHYAYALSCRPPDRIGPSTGLLSVDPNHTKANPNLTASIIDDISNVIAAEYFVDSIGLNGSGTIMNPQDGTFNSTHEIVTAMIDISGLGDVSHTIYVHGKDSAGNWGSFNCTTFKVDRIAPTITIFSPENTTYIGRLIDLNTTADELIDTWMFCLNDASNLTFIPNAAIAVSLGLNRLTVYANDTAGNIGLKNITWTNKLPANINCSLSELIISLGESVLIFGLLDHPTNEGLVSIQYSLNGTVWVGLFSGHPEIGVFSGNWTPSANGTYLIRGIWSGSAFHNGSTSSPKTLTVLIPSDIAITDLTLSKNIVCEGFSCDINATFLNEGSFVESFNVSFYANTSLISMEEIVLESGNSTTIPLTWNTTGWIKGNYTISAYIAPVPGEIDLSDNNFTDGWVFVTIQGDVDGDRDVDIYDVVKITGIYGSKRGDPQFNPNSDLDDDGEIKIYDVVMCTSHYRQSW